MRIFLWASRATCTATSMCGILPRLVEALDDHGDAVRHLLARLPEDLLADELGDEESHRLIRERVGLEEERLLGEQSPHLREQAIGSAGALAR